MSSITIIMYHYVREIKRSVFPDIKGLELDAFKRQLDYLVDNFQVISAQQLIAHTLTQEDLPKNACLLSFDDGYKDHYQFVFPELIKRKLSGAFFPPVKPIIDRELLDVNAIHYILACHPNPEHLVKELQQACLERGISQQEFRDFWTTYGVANRFDTKEVVFFKRMLQHILPQSIRHHISDHLFKKYVSSSPPDFAADLYMSNDEVCELVAEGMYVGSHGHQHLWLNHESPLSQALDIDLSLEFLKKIGAPTEDWIMCYPYGAYNDETLTILKSKKCRIGFTTQVGVADLTTTDLLSLPRFDTNDFPQ